MFPTMLLAAWIISIGTVSYLSITPQIELPIGFRYADMLYHAVAYAWLSFLPFFGFQRIRTAILCALIMIPLGFGLEVGQSFVPGRFSSIADAIANTLGVALGMFSGTYVRSLSKKKLT